MPTRRASPKAVEIRSWQVGFGDCFLLTFVYADDDRRHILIDFGSTGLPRKGKPSVHMPKIAQAIADECGDAGLLAVIATHRHADHINGFATGDRVGRSGRIIRALKPKLVLQPWTEDPRARPMATTASTSRPVGTGIRAATASYVASLDGLNALAARVVAYAASEPKGVSAAARRRLGFLGETNIANRSAIENLQAMGAAKGAKARYLRHGDRSGLERFLPGVKVHVLGPPDLRQTRGIERQRSSDAEEFWQLVKGVGPSLATAMADARAAAVTRPRRGGKRTASTAATNAASATTVPVEARWFCRRLDTLNERGLLEIVRRLDAQLNNTSLILLFEVGGRTLLFPGDAQLENWTWALQDAPDASRTRALVAGADFYKVGHHGSRNATPRRLLWDLLARRRDRRLASMLSTLGGKHGSAPAKTEVPRRTLVRALRAAGPLQTTQELKGKVLCGVWRVELGS